MAWVGIDFTVLQRFITPVASKGDAIMFPAQFRASVNLCLYYFPSFVKMSEKRQVDMFSKGAGLGCFQKIAEFYHM